MTRIYSQSTTTLRDFTQDATRWNVIATNGAVVNLSSATYDNDTNFLTESGGSFVFAVAEEPLGAGRFSGVELSKK